MPLFAATLEALAPLFLLILLGYGLKRARVLHPAHVPVLNGLVVNVTLPALIVKGLIGTPHLALRDALPPVGLIVTQFVALGLLYALGRALRFARPVQGAMMLTGTFSNTSFLGYPITLALLPHFFPETILIDQFGMTIMMYFTAAIVGATWGAADEPGAVRAALKRFLRSPIFIAAIVGSLTHLVHWPSALFQTPALSAIGHILMLCLGYLGQGTTPIVLLALGVALRPNALLRYPTPIVVACTVKLLVVPAVMWVVLRLFGLHGGAVADGVLIAAMPTSVVTSVLSAEYDMAGEYAVSVVCASTALAVISVPLLLSLLR